MGRGGGAALCGSLGWAEAGGEAGSEAGGDAGGHAGGDVGSEAGREGVDFPPELLLLLGIVAATSVPELFGAMSGTVGPATWQLLAQCCQVQAEELEPHMATHDSASNVRVATEAQHALLTCAGRSAKARLAANESSE